MSSSSRSVRSTDRERDSVDPTTIGAPGRNTLSSRHIMRKERDDNGVAADADQALDRADGSTGSQLPGELRSRFEGSLGADLSSVRVHTGSESVQSAEAVGARAYTLGQDIHFGAGQYDPNSSGGQLLIAHEVAHTVQQSGGATQPQFKLEVSTPGDAAEVEADRAASAMIVGQAATVSGGGGVARQVMREKAEGGQSEDPATCDPKTISPVLNGPNQWKPDPNDPVHKPPTDWGALPGNAPDGPPPGELSPPPSLESHTKAYVNQDGKPWDCGHPGERLPQQAADEAKMQAATAAFSNAWLELSSTTSAAYPGITGYFDTAKELQGDLHAKLGWSGTGGGGMGDLAKKQDGAEHVFGKQDGDLGKDPKIDTKHDPAKQGALDEAKRKVNIARSEAETAANEYVTQVERANNAATQVSLAVKALDLKAKKDDAKKLESDKKKLESDKAAAVKGIDFGVKTCQGIAKIAFAVAKNASKPDPIGLAGSITDVGLWAAGEVVKSIVSNSFDDKIAAVAKAVNSINIEINHDEYELLNDQLAAAKATFNTENTAIATKRTTVADKLGNVQTAYNDFAKVAGDAAGGTDDNKKKVQEAIALIPKVENLMGKLVPISGSLKVPAYTPDAGIGFNANAAVSGPFVQHYCLVKGYKERFNKEEKDWADRLKSLRAVADGMAK